MLYIMFSMNYKNIIISIINILIIYIFQFDTPNNKISVDSLPLKISIVASTVWGSSQIVTIYSPIPSPPTDIRIFANFSDQTKDIILQHSSVDNITNYEVICFYQIKNAWVVFSNNTIMSNNTRTIWSQLAVNTDYLFKVIFYYYLIYCVLFKYYYYNR